MKTVELNDKWRGRAVRDINDERKKSTVTSSGLFRLSLRVIYSKRVAKKGKRRVGHVNMRGIGWQVWTNANSTQTGFCVQQKTIPSD